MAVFTACCATSSPPVSPSQDEARIAAMRERTVVVTVSCQEGGGWGSGVLIKPYNGGELVATANHVVDNPACSYTVNGRPAVVLVQDEAHDTALIWADTTRLTTEFNLDPYLGMPIVAVGYPSQLVEGGEQGLQVTRGHIVAENGRWYRISASIWFGSSGGPSFDESGRLVGLNVAVLAHEGFPTDDQYFMTPAEYVYALVETLQ